MACGRVRSSRSGLAKFDQIPLLSTCGCTGAAILIVRKAVKAKILREQLHSPRVPSWISTSGGCTSEAPSHRRTCSVLRRGVLLFVRIIIGRGKSARGLTRLDSVG